MKFIVGYPKPEDNPLLTAYLIPDNWNDWHKFYTLYSLLIFDESGHRIGAGGVKIGEFGQLTPRPSIPSNFEKLDKSFFSLGQNENYYETIHSLSSPIRVEILVALRDCAFDLSIFDLAQNEPVMETSLLRYIDPQQVRNRFNRIIYGNAKLTGFEFYYQFPDTDKSVSPLGLNFTVEPNSNPPTNIHVIIGRNGVGKTRCFHRMSGALKGDSPEIVGTFNSFENTIGANAFANLVFVAFSAFDPFDPLPEGELGSGKFRYAYVGLRRSRKKTNDIDNATDISDQSARPPKTLAELTEEFVRSLLECSSGPRAERWQDAITILATDPLFEEAGISKLLESDSEESLKANAHNTFEKLSSGHKIVLLTITRLVELVDERTLVLIDEPEAHLHPPLLAAFVRALSFLLIKRNGVAIIATHSPVVLQETPKSCVWIMSRSGEQAIAKRPDIETFGENVGVLTREVFGLEVTHSGFHRVIQEAANEVSSYEDLLTRFKGQLGAEARAIARMIFASRTSDTDPE